jgi:hypothetical protein
MDAAYSAIQLATHFQSNDEVRKALRQFYHACHPGEIQDHQGLPLRTKRPPPFQTVLSMEEGQEPQAISRVVEQVIALCSARPAMRLGAT